jgi:hypothetical protein
MAINPTLELTYKSGEVKRIDASEILGDMRADAIWYSDKAGLITSVPTTLSNNDKEWLVWNRGDTIKIKFTADGDAYDGQGFLVHGYPVKWTVDALDGTVYIIPRKYHSMADTKADMYANANRSAAQAEDVLHPGDALLCAKDSWFTLRLETSSNVYPQYLSGGFVQAALAE